MACEILTTEKFEKQAKRLIKKYPSLKNEIIQLSKNLSENPKLGTSLGNSFYKIRLAVKSKGKGKSGGVRVITFLVTAKAFIEEVKRVYLAAIFDKSEFESISNKELERVIKDISKD